MTSIRRTNAIIFLVLFAFGLALWLPRFKGPIDLRWDAGAYYILATSLREGQGYKLLNEPGDIDATQYPPLLPAIVAAHQWLLGTSDAFTVGRWLRLSSFIIFITYTFTSYTLLKGYLPTPYAFLATLICLLNLQIIFLSDLCSPEILYGVFTCLFILGNKYTSRRVSRIGSFASTTASYALRTLGVSLIASMITECLFNKQFRRAIIISLGALIPILSWQSYILFIESGQRYKSPAYEYQRADYLFYNVSYAKNMSLKDPFSPEYGYVLPFDIANRFKNNISRIPINLGETISAPTGFWLKEWSWINRMFSLPFDPVFFTYFILIVLSAPIFCGIGLQLLQRKWLIPLYILLYLFVICLTPWPEQFTRYIAPLTPFLALSLYNFFFVVKDNISNTLHIKSQILYPLLIGSFTSVVLIQQSLVLFRLYTTSHQEVMYEDQSGRPIKYRLFYYSEAYRALDAGLDWLRERARPADVVATTMPHWVYLRTGLKAVMPPFEADRVKAQHLLDSVPVRYVILDEVKVEGNFTGKYATPVVENAPDRWQRVYSSSDVEQSGQKPVGKFAIYQRVSPPISMSSQNP